MDIVAPIRRNLRANIPPAALRETVLFSVHLTVSSTNEIEEIFSFLFIEENFSKKCERYLQELLVL